MESNDYKAISEIMADSIEAMTCKPMVAVLLADYFENETININTKRRYDYLAEHKGEIPKKELKIFDKKKFLKDCGLENAN